MRQRRGAGAATADRATLVFAAAGIAAAALLPFVRVRPNRVADGAARLLAQADPAAAAALVLLWGVAGAAAILRLTERARARVSTVISIGVPFFAILAAGLVTGRLAGTDPIVRVSLSAGFWATAVIGYASFLSASQGIGQDRWPARRILGFSVPVFLGVLVFSGFLDSVSVMRELAAQKTVFLSETATHLVLAGTAVLVGCLLGIPIGVLSVRHLTVRRVTFFILNIVQTIPSLALFGVLILPLAALSRRYPVLHQMGISGIGRAPAILALSFYAMLPIARNTFTALAGIPLALRDAGKGMGMTRGHLLVRVEVPLALPLILAGVRTAAVQSVGNAVVTALIGAGGLGVFIFQGLGQYAADMILLGTLPVIALAMIIDMLMGGLVRLLTPKPLREAAA
jgi:osmoprotectant transport system permease protein